MERGLCEDYMEQRRGTLQRLESEQPGTVCWGTHRVQEEKGDEKGINGEMRKELRSTSYIQLGG